MSECGVLCRTKTITVDGLGEVTARELTVAEVKRVREMAAKIDEREPYMIEALLLDERFLMEAATLSTGLSAEQFDGELPPSAAAAVWAAVCEVNDFLSRFLNRARVPGAATT